MLNPEDFKHLSTFVLANEASKRGIKVSKIFNEGIFAKRSFLKLSFGGRIEYIVGQRTSQIDSIAYFLQKDKYVTKHFLSKNGVSVAPGEVFGGGDVKEVVKYVNNIGFPVVVKPLSGLHGTDVFVNINNENTLEEVIGKIGKDILVEKMFSGTEYRLLATKEKFVAATNRVPANVIGDGSSTIQELIGVKNSDPRRVDGYTTGLVKIKIDDQVTALLEKDGLSLDSIPDKDKQIFLRENSNISTGGDSIDVTDEVHPGIKEIAVKAIKSIPGLGYGGIDFLTNKPISEKPDKDSYIVIEINDSPMLSMHHFPYKGKSRNAAGAIIDMLFPETI